MPRYTYEIPPAFLKLHLITMDVGQCEYIKITVGGRAKASAYNPKVAGVISQTLAAQDALKPVTSFFVSASDAKKATRKKDKGSFVFEWDGKEDGGLFDCDGNSLKFHWSIPGIVGDPLDVDELFPDPDNNNPRQFVRVVTYGMAGMMKLLEALNVQVVNFLFCGEGEPAVSHYVTWCEFGGELQSSFVTSMEDDFVWLNV